MNIPTAEELFKKYSNLYQFEEGNPEYLIDKEDFITAIKEFAKMHCKAALEAAEKSNFIDAKGISISPKSNNLHWTAYGSIGDIVYKKESILNAYPESNIK